MRAGAARAGSAEHCFLVPPLNGPVSGGTLYNRELILALAATSSICACTLSAPELATLLQSVGSVWVDSLYLESMPQLRRRTRARLGLIVHYLPTFVALGRAASRAELSSGEERALHEADAYLVPSAFMRDALEALVAPNQKPIFVVEPGTRALLPTFAEVGADELNVCLVGNVVPGKGIEPWLNALDAAVVPDDRLQVSIIGSLRAEAAYAERCLGLVRESSRLSARVSFLGELSPADTLARIARAGLFLSASRMESYGLALNEARVSGIPILARAGGNSATHVDARAGGVLAATDRELARACLAVARDPELRRELSARARAAAPKPRPWSAAAIEFLAQTAL